jgi:hypothetical protein
LDRREPAHHVKVLPVLGHIHTAVLARGRSLGKGT